MTTATRMTERVARGLSTSAWPAGSARRGLPGRVTVAGEASPPAPSG
jgi:hypothetical protein